MNAQISYKQESEILIPDLALEDSASQPSQNIGKYGLMRRDFLMNHRRGMYSHLLLSGTLAKHLLDTDREARETVERIAEGLLQTNPLPQTGDTMLLTAHRNGIRERAEEVALREIVYS